MNHAALIVDTATQARLMEKYALPASLSQEDFFLWERYDAIGPKFIRSFLKAYPYCNGFYCGVILRNRLFAANGDPVKVKGDDADLPPAILARIAAEEAKPATTILPYYQKMVEDAKKSRDASSRTAGAEMEACLRKNGMWTE